MGEAARLMRQDAIAGILRVILRNSSGGGQKRPQKSSKNLHGRPGSLLKNLAV
jgi:hypothetical protein